MSPQERLKAAEQEVERMLARLKELKVHLHVTYPDFSIVWVTRPGRKLNLTTEPEKV